MQYVEEQMNKIKAIWFILFCDKEYIEGLVSDIRETREYLYKIKHNTRANRIGEAIRLMRKIFNV